MTELKFNNVIKRYGKTEVVHGINLDVRDKEFLVLVGPSGCGKSTLLRMVAGLEAISDGTISIGGKVVNDLAPKERGLAMVFQNYALYPHMNVYENMSFGLRLNKTPKDEIDRRVQETGQILGLENLLHRKPHELSGGQRQRVAMGRAMVRKPSIFLFDEPLSNLDAKLRIQMRAEIKLLHQRVNSTIIYVTHDQVEAMTLADRIVVLRDGYIEQVGSPMELFSKPANTFVAGFIGTPPMNLLDAVIKFRGDNAFLIFDGGLEIPVPPGDTHLNGFRDGQSVVMGLRTEEITPSDLNPSLPASWKFDGLVEVVEPLGNETHVHVNIKGVKMIARSEGRRSIKYGDSLKFAMNLNQMHIFDAETTLSIY
ncbi:glycerol-3-phosphate transporter subunit; ATP-binding component of ABC superfamily [Desulfamplus magnetovallimortis]|uniref:Glycerol-3-phosphate transporter subunit ATP-binding component of ABC superfamily n=1 Tax=Desulfamplus magnetovallimortis TaxID=1246637 RepID=A0A1W1H7M6_9BACT|nr:sn-glycerol-3-phosphate ABC transporter ATP-binding protein UgpC [Desulfamplus magnetovallimortis]SLM28385.1 glycerol-3-phosphate transporter subunit; ATP-binding component of ABC superfamily [Desulfamplus magnetovallimortis]